MIKSLLKYTGLFALSFVLIFLTHRYILLNTEVTLPFALLTVYVFHGLFSIGLILLFYFLEHTDKFKGQVGFLYLISVVLKAVLFFIIFNGVIFNDQTFTRIEAASLLTPLFIGLTFEVFILSKLLKVQASIKNE